jgi:hypothetical protein
MLYRKKQEMYWNAPVLFIPKAKNYLAGLLTYSCFPGAFPSAIQPIVAKFAGIYRRSQQRVLSGIFTLFPIICSSEIMNRTKTETKLLRIMRCLTELNNFIYQNIINQLPE